jgi:hypothetical protein
MRPLITDTDCSDWVLPYLGWEYELSTGTVKINSLFPRRSDAN